MTLAQVAIPLILNLILAGDYWADYHECVAPCDVVATACYAPCTAERTVCEAPCNTDLNSARRLEELSEIVACMSGPAPDASVWCVIQLRGFAVTCVDSLPHWCLAYDHDGDGDVDLEDFAAMGRR